MIKFELKNQTNPEFFSFRVELDPRLEKIIKDPLKIKFLPISKTEGWETLISPGQWTSWNGGVCSRWDIEIRDFYDRLLFQRTYDSLYDGSEIDKFFNLFCKMNPNSKGIVIGSHDGTWGHWVQSVLNKETECIIVEGSKDQYNKLEKTYGEKENCILINEIISSDGGEVEWYSGGDGYTDSLILDIHRKFLKGEDPKRNTRKSVDINELIENYNYQDFDWLHTDVEGYDSDLIMSLKYHPRMIVFENEHVISLGKYSPLIDRLDELGYSIIEFGIDTIAIRE
jgi:FkbM family methyltransferase